MDWPTTPVKSKYSHESTRTPSHSQTPSRVRLAHGHGQSHIYFTPSKYGSPLKTRRQKLPDSAEKSIILGLEHRHIFAGFVGKRKAHATIDLVGDYEPLWDPPTRVLDQPLFETRLIRHLIALFTEKLLVAPQGSSTVVIESAFMTNPVKSIIVTVLRDHFYTVSTVFVPACVCALIEANQEHGIVIEFGNYETAITPVYDLRPLAPLMQYTSRGTEESTTIANPSDYYLKHSGRGGEAEIHNANDDNEDDDDDGSHSLPRLIKTLVSAADIDLRRPLLKHIILVNCPSVAISDSLEQLYPNSSIVSLPDAFIGCSAYLSAIY